MFSQSPGAVQARSSTLNSVRQGRVISLLIWFQFFLNAWAHSLSVRTNSFPSLIFQREAFTEKDSFVSRPASQQTTSQPHRGEGSRREEPGPAAGRAVAVCPAVSMNAAMGRVGCSSRSSSGAQGERERRGPPDPGLGTKSRPSARECPRQQHETRSLSYWGSVREERCFVLSPQRC